MNKNTTLNLTRASLLFLTLSGGLAQAEPILGAWTMEEFSILSKNGGEAPFCADGTGIIIYDASGTMSVSINCPAGAVSPEPADAYGRMLFYAGKFEKKDDSLLHAISNSSVRSLIGKTVLRKIDQLSEDQLILTGNFGFDGDTLRITWKKR